MRFILCWLLNFMFTVQACVWYLFACIPLLKILFTKLINSNMSIWYSILRNWKNSQDEIIIIKKTVQKLKNITLWILKTLCHKICYKEKKVFVQRVLRTMMQTRTYLIQNTYLEDIKNYSLLFYSNFDLLSWNLHLIILIIGSA